MELFDEVVVAVRGALDGLDDWGLMSGGAHSGQHFSDVAADRAALDLLDRAGVGVLSEESGLTRGDHEIVVIIDPVDGSTNASHALPWYATSLAAVDADGLRAALVVNQASGTRYSAVRGGGAFRDGTAIRPSGCTSFGDALAGLSGLPPMHLGWSQFRALGACALDLCAVASGSLDAYLDCSGDAHGVWDYAGGMLICQEVGATVVDARGRDLVVMDHLARRTPVATCTKAMVDEVLAARSKFA